MAILTKISLRGLIAILYMTNLTTIAMNYPQLQLQNPTKHSEIVTIDCKIMITNKTRNPIRYAPEKYHNSIFRHTNLPSNIQDPIIFCEIIEPPISPVFPFPLPAKQLVNLSNTCTLQICSTHGTIPFKDPSLRDKPLLINLSFITNPHLKGKNFDKQFKDAFHIFCIFPLTTDPDDTQKLEEAGVLISEKIQAPLFKFEKTFSHGPNGIPNEKILVKSIFDEQIPRNKNIFKSIVHRQITGK